jgi:hypothetical protein
MCGMPLRVHHPSDVVLNRWGSQGNAARPRHLPRARPVRPGKVVYSGRSRISHPGVWLWSEDLSRHALCSQEHLGEYGWHIGRVRHHTYGGRSSREGIHLRDHIVRRLLLKNWTYLAKWLTECRWQVRETVPVLYTTAFGSGSFVGTRHRDRIVEFVAL